jgi:WD40 repeat protein
MGQLEQICNSAQRWWLISSTMKKLRAKSLKQTPLLCHDLGSGVLARRPAGCHRLLRQHGAAMGGAVRQGRRHSLWAHGGDLGSGVLAHGRLVVTGYSDSTARLWEAPSAKAVATLSGDAGSISAVAFSPDGRLVLAGFGDSTARLWEAASGKAVATLSGHKGPVWAVAFSPDGQLVLTGSSDNTARLWEAASAKAVATLSGHTGLVSAVAFSPDGRLVLAGSTDRTARLWPVLAGTHALVEMAKSIVPRCLTPPQLRRFHLAPEAARWCYTMQLWPYDDQAKNPPPRLTWDQRLVAAWDWMMRKTSSQLAATKP